jgi:hypothetical protein
MSHIIDRRAVRHGKRGGPAQIYYTPVFSACLQWEVGRSRDSARGERKGVPRVPKPVHREQAYVFADDRALVLELSERAPGDEEPFAWMRDRAERALDAVEESTVAVIGKSLGSAAAPLVAERGLPAVWLTPLLIRPDIVSSIRASPGLALLIGSSSDPTWSDGEQPGSESVEVLELEGLDHSLQVEGDPLASLDVLRAVTERIGAFLERRASCLSP